MPVVSAADSVTGLGRTGAQNLPKKQGRGLIQVEGRLVEFQSFRVDYPMPTEDGLKWLETHLADSTEEPKPTMAESLPTAAHPVDEARILEARILELDGKGKSPTAIIREVWGSTGGGQYYQRADLVKAILAKKGTTSTTSTPEMPPNGLLEAV